MTQHTITNVTQINLTKGELIEILVDGKHYKNLMNTGGVLQPVTRDKHKLHIAHSKPKD